MMNPFTFTFGKEPGIFIHPITAQQRVVAAFEGEGEDCQVYVLTGLRGSGKTVLLSNICNVMSDKDNWIVVQLNPERDLLKAFAAALASHSELKEYFKIEKINLSALGLGLEISGVESEYDIEIAIAKMLDIAKKRNKKILIGVDEVTSSQQMREFAAAFQIFVRTDKPVYLLMTGLYENIMELQNQNSLTFLYRAPKIKMEPINIGAMTNAYEDKLETDKDTALEMARLTMGYPYAFQVLGALCYDRKCHYSRILPQMRQILEEYVYNKIWDEMTRGDKKILNGIARACSGRIKDIREVLGIDNNSFNPYRKRLMDKGVINGEEYGTVRFTLPFFREFVIENYFGDDI